MNAVPVADDHPQLLTPQEVADRFRVDAKTVTRWARTGKIPDEAVVWTLGGHRRYLRQFIDQSFPGQQ